MTYADVSYFVDVHLLMVERTQVRSGYFVRLSEYKRQCYSIPKDSDFSFLGVRPILFVLIIVICPFSETYLNYLNIIFSHCLTLFDYKK